MSKIRICAFILCIVFGLTSIVVSGIGIFGYNSISCDTKTAVSHIQNVLPSRTMFDKIDSSYDLPILSHNKIDFVFLLEQNDKKLRMPVASEWDGVLAKTVPCRIVSGDFKDTIVIGGGNFAQKIDIADIITLTNMRGMVYKYKVDKVVHKCDFNESYFKSGDKGLTIFSKNRDEFIFVYCSEN